MSSENAQAVSCRKVIASLVERKAHERNGLMMMCWFSRDGSLDCSVFEGAGYWNDHKLAPQPPLFAIPELPQIKIWLPILVE